jgi:hypothetical protein
MKPDTPTQNDPFCVAKLFLEKKPDRDAPVIVQPHVPLKRDLHYGGEGNNPFDQGF